MRIRNLFVAIPAALLSLWAATAAATTYYVSTTGNAANSGTQLSPWTLAKANSSLLAGDVAILAPGTYTTAIIPASSGSAARYITYVGALGAPTTTIVPSITLAGKPYISVKGVRFGGDVSITAAHDSLSYCNSTNGTPNITAVTGDYLTVDHCTLIGPRWGLGGSALNQTATGPQITDWILNPTITNTTATITLTSYGPALEIGACRNATFDRSRFFVINGSGGYHGLMKLYGSRFGSFTNCTFDFTNTRSGNQDEDGFVALRDSSYKNTFARDSFYTHGPGYVFMNFGSDGSWFPGSTKTQKWDRCQFRFGAHNNVAYEGVSVAYCFAGATSDTFTNNVVVSDFAPFLLQDHSNSLISNNTFITLNSQDSEFHSGTKVGSDFGGSWRSSTVTNNIFYSQPHGETGKDGVALYMDIRPDPSGWDGNYNLYYCSNAAGSSIYAQTGLTGPGASGNLCTGYSADCNSKYGDPLFVGGGTTAATFDPHLRSGSPAIGAGLGGVDIGALPFGASGSDVTPPSAITNLAAALVTDNQAQLNWTAPGDDGTTGQASAYDIRMSTSPITALNFDSASPVANSLTPRPSGSSEQFLVQGLTPGTLLFFAIKAIDEASNRAAISNVLSLTTTSTDTTPPAAIQDLSAQ